jgi:hypothetical protein
MLDGKVTACLPRHRHRELLRFLRLLDQESAPISTCNRIVDN